MTLPPNCARRLGANQERMFQALQTAIGADVHTSPPSDVALVRRFSWRTCKHEWYQRTRKDGRIQEARVVADADLPVGQIALYRAQGKAARTRKSTVRALVRAGFGVPPAPVVEVLTALASILDRLVLVDGWAPLFYPGATMVGGLRPTSPAIDEPLAFVLGAGVDVQAVQDLLNARGGDWAVKCAGTPGVTRLGGPTATIVLYDERLGEAVAQIRRNARRGILLTGVGIGIKVASPLDQVFWDRWYVDPNAAQRAGRNARTQSLALWAARADASGRLIVGWWRMFAPAAAAATLSDADARVRAALEPQLMRIPDEILNEPIGEVPAGSDEGPDRLCPVEWGPAQREEYAAFKREMELGRDRLNLNRGHHCVQLAKLQAANPKDADEIGFVERELRALEIEERNITLRLSRKVTELDAAARSATRRSGAR